NQSHLGPTPPLSQHSSQQSLTLGTNGMNGMNGMSMAGAQQQPSHSNNPFLAGAPGVQAMQMNGMGHQKSQESVDFGSWGGTGNGRHSPDAFAHLSFRQQ